jgi:hypothetical protein
VVLPQTLFRIVEFGTLKMTACVPTEICNLGFRRERGGKGKENKYERDQISQEVETVLSFCFTESEKGPDRRVKGIADMLCERPSKKNQSAPMMLR